MTAQWNTNVGGAQSAAGDVVNQDWGIEGSRLVKGVWSAFTDNANATDPSAGAPVPWGSREVGAVWLDTGVDGTPASPVLKRWQQLTSTPTYGWRTLRLRKIRFIPDPTLAAVVFAPASPAAADVPWTDVALATTLDGAAPGDVQDAGQLQALVSEVLLQVEVTADAAETLTDPTKGYIAFRAKGASFTNQDERVYAQVAARPVQQQVWVPLAPAGADAEKMQFKVVVGGGVPSFVYSAKIVAIAEWI